MDRWQFLKKLATTSPSVRKQFMEKMGAPVPNGAPPNSQGAQPPGAQPPNGGAQPPNGGPQQAAQQAVQQPMMDALSQAFNAEMNAVAAYTTFAACVSGAHRQYMKKFWLEEAKEELDHAQLVGEKICVMGGQPAIQGLQPADIRTNQSMLQQAMQMETEAVGHYTQMAQMAEQMGMHGIKVVVEEILAAEQNHLDNTALMVKDLEHQDPNQALAAQASEQFQSIAGGGPGSARQAFPPASQMAQPAPGGPPGPPPPGPPPGPPQA